MRWSVFPRLALFFLWLIWADQLPAEPLRFEVKLAADARKEPVSGRVLVILQKGASARAPYRSIGATGFDAPPMLGKDAQMLAPGQSIILDADAPFFPLKNLNELPAGTYTAQAILKHNPELNIADAPGNLSSDPTIVEINPKKGGTITLLLKNVFPEGIPEDSDRIKYLKFRSTKLSEFHKRDCYLRVGIALPKNFAEDKDKRWPMRVVIGGYGSRFTGISQFRFRETGPFIVIHLDGAGPYGDPYQVDSANNGPYGAAITGELIPHIEKLYRGNGIRFTEGTSTGGWVSLALQIFYPKFFSGCWSFAPDSTDFRSYELINIYKDTNAYVNRYGFERPAKRDVYGDCVYTVRHETQMEIVLGYNNAWYRSGKDWSAWNATFGPRGPDGHPAPLWNGQTGVIDPSVTEHWKKYDLSQVLKAQWEKDPKALARKIHIFVGDADDYFLNNGVRRLQKETESFEPAFDGKIQIGPYANHGYHPISDAEMIQQMLQRVK